MGEFEVAIGACRLFPRRYADRVELDVAVDQQIRITAAAAAAERRLEMLREEDPQGARARIGAGGLL